MQWADNLSTGSSGAPSDRAAADQRPSVANSDPVFASNYANTAGPTTINDNVVRMSNSNSTDARLLHR